MMLSIMSAPTPCVLGGSSLTVQPRYVVWTGVTHSGRKSARSLGRERAALGVRERHQCVRGATAIEAIAPVRRRPRGVMPPDRGCETSCPRRARGLRGRYVALAPGSADSTACASPHMRASTSLTGKPRLGVMDRRSEYRGEGQAAEPLAAARPIPRPRQAPSPCKCRDSACEARLSRLVRGSASIHQLGRQARRSPAAGVEAVEFAGLGLVDDREEIAAHAVHHRLHQPEVALAAMAASIGIAAALEDLDARHRCERLARRDNAVRRRDDRAARPMHGRDGRALCSRRAPPPGFRRSLSRPRALANPTRAMPGVIAARDLELAGGHT